jgi:hypothetical protein
MPVKVTLDDDELWIKPTLNWQRIESFANKLSIHADFYVSSQNLLGN